MAYQTIKKITPIEHSTDVFNLHVKDNHNYFAEGLNVSNCHNFKANSLTSIMENMPTTPLRFGFTGTINDMKMHRLVLEGLFGPVTTLSKTYDLIEKGILANLKIRCLVLKYPVEDCISCPYKYQDEMNFLCQHEGRTEFIKNLTLDQKGNTLILFQYIEKHGIPLYETIKKDINKDRPLYIVHGKIKADEREKIRTLLKSDKDAIIVASYGTFAEGIDIPRLHNVIFASPYKSKIKVLQSIGRGLRRASDKTKCVLYDIADDLSTKKRRNYTFEHYKTRIRYYAEEEFVFKEIKVDLS